MIFSKERRMRTNSRKNLIQEETRIKRINKCIATGKNINSSEKEVITKGRIRKFKEKKTKKKQKWKIRLEMGTLKNKETTIKDNIFEKIKRKLFSEAKSEWRRKKKKEI